MRLDKLIYASNMSLDGWTEDADGGFNWAPPDAGVALDGAAALGDALQAAGDDYRTAFRNYHAGVRPYVEAVQAEAIRTGLQTLVPRTEEAIRARNGRTGSEF